MTGDLISALFLFIGNVGHMGVLSYKVLKFTELEVSFWEESRAIAWPCVASSEFATVLLMHGDHMASAFVSTG